MEAIGQGSNERTRICSSPAGFDASRRPPPPGPCHWLASVSQAMLILFVGLFFLFFSLGQCGSHTLSFSGIVLLLQKVHACRTAEYILWRVSRHTTRSSFPRLKARAIVEKKRTLTNRLGAVVETKAGSREVVGSLTGACVCIENVLYFVVVRNPRNSLAASKTNGQYCDVDLFGTPRLRQQTIEKMKNRFLNILLKNSDQATINRLRVPLG